MDTIFIRLVDSKGSALTANSTLESNITPIKELLDPKVNQLIKISSFSSDVEQTLSIGSQTSGVGAGKVQFSPFTITKATDAISPLLFQYAAAGSHFKTVDIFFVNAQKFVTARHTYKLVAIKTISWSADSGEPGLMEKISFEYGALVMTFNQQDVDGRISKTFQGGWDRTKNVKDLDLNTLA